MYDTYLLTSHLAHAEGLNYRMLAAFPTSPCPSLLSWTVV